MKNVVISGAGEVGRYVAEVAKSEGMRVTIIETSADAIERVENNIDARIVSGSACHSKTLRAAEVEHCDVLMAATSLDEVNLLTASIGKKMGAKKVMARIHNTAYFDTDFDFRDSFLIDHFVCPEQLTARALASDLNEPATHQIPRFAQNEIEMRNFEITSKCQSLNKPLKDIKLPAGVRIALIRRLGRGIAPDAETMITTGDYVSVIGPSHAFNQVIPIFGKGKVGVQNLAISSASPVSEWLLKIIDKNHFRIKLFESNREKAENIATQHPWITVINEDPVESEIFNAEHLENCNAFLSLGLNQEHNILGAMQAKNYGVPNVGALIQSSNLLKILKNSGIDHLYSPRVEAAKAFLQVIDNSPIKLLARLDYKVALVFQVKVQEQCRVAGKILKDIDFPPNSFIAAIERENQVFCPTFKDQIEKGDLLITIGPRELKDFLNRTFVKTEES